MYPGWMSIQIECPKCVKGKIYRKSKLERYWDPEKRLFRQRTVEQPPLDCNRCRGTGNLGEKVVKQPGCCYRCNGKGYTFMLFECTLCSGTGVYHAEPSPTCGP